MRIAVMGTGGVGGYFGARLAAAGAQVTVIARGDHLRAIRARGLAVESPLGDVLVHPVRATAEPGEVGPVDVVMFCVKLWDTEAAGAAIRPMVGPGTAVISFQNGVDAQGRLAAILGPAAVMGGVAHISAVIAGPGIIHHTGRLASLFFGEKDGTKSARGQAFLRACEGAGIAARLSGDIERVIWEKFIFLTAFSGLTALTRKPIGPIRADPETWAMFGAAMAEAAALARVQGVTFRKDPVESWLEIVRDMPDDYRASMLTDLERGHRLELPWLSGAVARMGREMGVETPINAFIATALKLHVSA